MGLFGGGDDVNVTIGGDSSGLQSAVRQGEEAISSLGSTVNNMPTSLDGASLSWNGLANSVLGSLGGFGQFVLVGNQALGMLGQLVGPLEQAGQMALNFAEQIGSVAWDVAVSGMQELADAAQNLGQQMFDLNNATEKNVYSWSYTYGQGMSRASAIAQAQSMAAWTGQFSMDIPFTRQDLMGALSGGAMLGNAQTIEQYMPMIADLAATHVNPMTGQPVTLGEAVQAIRGEKMGLSRMLKYQLGINPEDLIKYGLDATASGAGAVHINNPDTLLPALQAYSEANGWTSYQNGTDQGAAYNTAHATFWGAQSSFMDRIQNWLLRAGGMDMSGNVGKGTFFGSLKDDLNGISDWIDKHQGDLNHVADLIGNVFAGGVKVASNAVEDLANGLHASGLDTLLENLLGQLGGWLNSSDFKNNLQPILQEIGLLAGNIGSGGLESGVKAIQGLFTGLQESGAGGTIMADLNAVGQWLADPAHQQAIAQVASIIGQIAGGAIQNASTVLHQFFDALGSLTPEQIASILHFLAGLEEGFMILGTTIADATPILADFFRLFEDFQHNNGLDIPAAMGQLRDDMGKWKDDMGGDIKTVQTQFNSLINNASTWGADFSGNFAQGMYSKQADVQRAAVEQARLVSQYLHHSTPDVGPLAGDDKWGAELVTQFADSMTTAAPRLQQAALLVAQHAAGAYPFGPGGGGYRPGMGGSSSSYSTAYTLNGGDMGVNITLYGADAATVMAVIAQAQAKQGQQAHLLSVAPGLGGALPGGVGVLGAYGA